MEQIRAFIQKYNDSSIKPEVILKGFDAVHNKLQSNKQQIINIIQEITNVQQDIIGLIDNLLIDSTVQIINQMQNDKLQIKMNNVFILYINERLRNAVNIEDIIAYMFNLLNINKNQKKFIPEIFQYLKQLLVKINLEKSIDLKDNLEQNYLHLYRKNPLNQKKQIIFSTLNLINTQAEQSIKDSNYDINFEQILEQLLLVQQKMKQPNDFINNLIKKIQSVSQSYKQKLAVKLVKEKSLVKIRSLVPKIDEAFLPYDYSKPKVVDQKEIKKKHSLLKKQTMKQLTEEQRQVTKELNKNKETFAQQRETAYKGFQKKMQDQSLELKRLESTQMINKRISKKHSQRKAGNKT